MNFVVVIVLVIVILCALCGVISREDHLSGCAGEALVAGMLEKLPQEAYTILNDVMLPTKDGITTQIDHVVVSRYGIFVIETKDYGGWIFGDEKQREWTQSFHVGWGDTEKFRFQNPIRQNWRHVYVMSDSLNLPLHYFQNVVVFAGDGEFITEMPTNVLYCDKLLGYIGSFTLPVMSTTAVAKAINEIHELEASLTEDRRNVHVQNLEARHDPKKLSVQFANGELLCPRCGAKMVLRHRHSDRGAFYGCSNYPKCKGMLSA